MYSILIVEDDENILKLMDYRLSKSGFNTYTAKDGSEALEKIKTFKIDLMVADIMMPKMDGYELVERLRQMGNNLPVIFTTAKETSEDKQKGFSLGVDDYMVKPIDHEELVCRINAVMKRVNPYPVAQLRFNDTVLDYDNLTISDGQHKVLLTKREFDILHILLTNPNHTFSKTEILNKIWGYEADIYDETLKVHINRIRNKIQPFPDINIETVRGVGYRGVVNA